MCGLFEENGPLRLVKVNDKTELHSIDNSWLAVANIIFIDNPLGVGFSKGFSGNSSEVVAKTFYLFLEKFFLEYNEYMGNDFFITGESYAGHYIPVMAHYLLEQSFNKLKGIMIGNPYVDAVLQ